MLKFLFEDAVLTFVNIPPVFLKYVEEITLPWLSCVAFVAVEAFPDNVAVITLAEKFPEESL